MAASFKIVFNLKDLTIPNLPPESVESSLKIADKEFQLRLRELVSCELPETKDPPTIQLSFQETTEKRSLGSINIEIPQDIISKEEFELGNTFKLEESSIEGSYFLVVFNRTVNLKKISSVQLKKTLDKPDPSTLYSPSSILKKSNSGERFFKSGKPQGQVMTPDKNKAFSMFSTSTRDRSLGKTHSVGSRIKRTLQGSNSKDKQKIMEIMANDVKADGLNRAINRSLETSAKWIQHLEKDKEQISECLYLNSLKSDGEAPDFGKLDTNTLTKTQMNELLVDRKELSGGAKPTYELSPMKLKNKFDKEKDDKGKQQRSVESIRSDLEKFTIEQKNQTEYLKVVVLALDAKLKGLLNVEKDNELLKLEFSKSEETRIDLEKALRDATSQSKLDQMSNQTLFNKLMEDKHAVDEKLKELMRNFEKSNNAPNNAPSLENELREAKINLKNFDEVKKQNVYLKNQIEGKEKKIQELNDTLTNKAKEFYRIIHEIEEQRDNVFKEKIQLSSELNETKLKYESEKQKVQELKYDIDGLTAKIDALSLHEGTIKQLQEDKKRVEEELKDARIAMESQNSMVEKLKIEALSKMRECDDDGKRIIEKNKTLEQKILALEIQNNEKNNQLTTLKKQIFEVKNENMRLEKQVMIKQSQNIRIESLKEREDKLAQENQDYRSQIGLLSDQVLLQDNKTLDLHNTIKELKSSVSERDDYNVNLKKLILEMREKEGSYIPMKDDAIDRKLANFISTLNDPGKLKIMFVREGEGVYQFGSKRVHVKIEQDKIYIRVGGGYISVEEFLDIYTPIELEKMLKNNPVSVLSKNIAVNNILAGRMVKEIERGKNSPLTPKTTGVVFTPEK